MMRVSKHTLRLFSRYRAIQPLTLRPLLSFTPPTSSSSRHYSQTSPTLDTREFQAETKQLLDIVTNSIYTDKEVFLREIISNASDALEKLRHLQAANSVETQGDSPLEIQIALDETTSTITITDTGVGMTRDDMIANLGTIARSGSKQFVAEQMQESDHADIIGKFGVGFYSAFMVADKVEVRSQSALNADPPAVWSSDGTGTYRIDDLAEDVRQDRGTSIVMHMKEEYWDFVDEKRIEEILNKYSNFVGFPIFLNGKRINTVEAVWTKDPKSVEEKEYTSFYRYIANAMDEPLDTYHFRVDAPLDIKGLFFIPSFHSEKYGMPRMEPAVSLYCRKILIESKSTDILPDWMRFVKGVVDSEDLPLSLSREKAQDSALIRRLKGVLTRKFIAHLASMAKNDKDKYVNEFYKEFGFFLKEGICQDYENQTALTKLLYFETSKTTGSELVTLDEYIARMKPEQSDIYYLVAPTRDAAVNSPYLETFEKAGVEVLLVFTSVDDFVMANVENYEGKKLVSVEEGNIDLSALSEEKEVDDKEAESKILSKEQQVELCSWLQETLSEKVAKCTTTNRLSNSPAIVTGNESGAMRRMMRMLDTGDGNKDGIPLPKQHMEINPDHPIIVGINDLRQTEPVLARTLSDQVFDNCLVAAGLLDDSRSMLPRINDLLISVVKSATDGQGATDDQSGPEKEEEANEK